jgi:hypothetical protein
VQQSKARESQAQEGRSRSSMLGRAALAILCFRVCLALLTDTFFQPDEFYQSLEIAHHAVFGYGYVTWEWAIERPVRSPVYPALYMAVYQLIKLLRLDDTRLLVRYIPSLRYCFTEGTAARRSSRRRS